MVYCVDVMSPVELLVALVLVFGGGVASAFAVFVLTARRGAA